MNSELLTPVETAAMLKVRPGTLANWRTNKVGPAYCHAGKAVRYRLSDIEAWLSGSVAKATKVGAIDGMAT